MSQESDPLKDPPHSGRNPKADSDEPKSLEDQKTDAFRKHPY
jgi:hypothetical protein